ncbi:AsmA family protein [Pseudooceanicola sp.]|uniref:AsmA family protein n=1 Tax=Pseudooceanicola sp. TaxID=1914328 RepID=UPI00405884ED
MRLIRLLIGTVLVFVLVLGAGLFLVPGEKIAQVAADELTRRTGREVQIAGEAKISLWPDLGVTVAALKIANAEWSDNGPMFQARSVTIGVDAAALMRGEIKIRTLRADNPEILLERNAEGNGNWVMARQAGAGANAGAAREPTRTPPSAPASPSRALPAFTLDRADIAGASIYYVDHRTGEEISQRDIDLALTYPDAGGELGLDLTLRPTAEVIRVKGVIQDPAAFIAAAITPLTLDITGPGTKARFEGRGSIVPEAEGRLTLDISDTSALAIALRQTDPALPEGLGRDLALSGAITWTRDGKLALREGKLTSGTNTAAVALDLSTAGPRPRLNAQLVADKLNLAPQAASGAAPSGKPDPASGWSTAPIDASALALLDGEIALSAASVDIGATRLGATRAVVAVDRARAVVTLREVEVFEGTLRGELVANNRNGLSVGGEVEASGIALARALSDLAGLTRFTGDASARIKFLGVGQTVAAIMNSLSGEGVIDTGRGTIEGLDLDRLFRGGDPSGGTTIFDATNATFSIENGVLSNKDLLMKLAGIEARGEGLLGLGEQQVDYLFTPISLTARDGRGIAIPVRIRGPWAGPKITLDLDRAIQMNASEEKARLEEKVRQKVADELGLDQAEGESTEDAVRRTIKEEAAKGLLNLLNR